MSYCKQPSSCRVPASLETILQAQTQFRQERGLSRIPAVRNHSYTRNGTKSYVRSLNRYGFQPTKPGPYFYETAIENRESLVGRPRLYTDLVKRIAAEDSHPDGDKTVEVTAEDSQNDMEYLVEISIGTPPQKAVMDFDTGSSDLWVRTGKNSWWSSLAKSDHATFDPKKSETFKHSQGQTWSISYGDGSSASGDVGTDNVTIGGLLIKDQSIELTKHMSSEFSKGPQDGLLGLGFPKINTIKTNGEPDPQPTPVVNMIKQDDIPKDAELFTTAFYSSRDAKGEKSFYTFGWIDDELVKASGEDISWTDVDTSEGFWMFDSTSAEVNGKKVAVSGNKAIADTGTTLAMVSDEVCEALYKEIKGSEYSEKYQGYLIPTDVKLEDLPDFSVAVGDKQFVIQKEDLLFAPADEGQWYGGVQSRGNLPFDILGDVFLKSIYAIFDQGRNRFGCVPKIEKTQNITPPREEPQGSDGSESKE